MIDMSVDTMKRLFDLPNITGVKDATGNIARVSLQRARWGMVSTSFPART